MARRGVIAPAAEAVSRRGFVQGSAHMAGALALASQIDVPHVLAQPDAATPTPRLPAASRELRFDFPGLEVGVAEYAEGPTGCTVFSFSPEAFPDGVTLELDVRGGEPGYVGDYGSTYAICLAGGSGYGLEAAAGVAAELFAQSGHQVNAAVAGAVIFDVAMIDTLYGLGGSGIYPDKVLGQAALRAARPGWFPLGPHGAGASAAVGKWRGFDRREAAGQGAAFRQIGAIRVAVFTVVNALGVIVDRQGRVVRGGLDRQTGTRSMPLPDAEQLLAGVNATPQPGGSPPSGAPINTTLTVLLTNVDFPQDLLRQLGRQVHASMARAIQPFHAPEDGDILFTASTGEIAADDIDSTAVGVIASELAWDAVLTSFDPGT